MAHDRNKLIDLARRLLDHNLNGTISTAKEKFSPLIDEISKQFSKDSSENNSKTGDPK